MDRNPMGLSTTPTKMDLFQRWKSFYSEFSRQAFFQDVVAGGYKDEVAPEEVGFTFHGL